MRYFQIKPEQLETVGTENVETKWSYRVLFDALIGMPSELTPAEFLRVGKVYNDFNSVKDGEFLHLEDNDYTLLQKKLASYIKVLSTQSGSAQLVKSIIFNEFVNDIIEMPKKLPALEPVVA